MKTLISFILVAVVVLFAVSTVCVAENIAEKTSDTKNIPIFNSSLNTSGMEKDCAAFSEKTLTEQNSKVELFILKCASDNVLSAAEMKEIKTQVDALAKLKSDMQSELGTYFVINPEVLQSIEIKKNLFDSYFSYLFFERDESNKIKYALEKITGQPVFIEGQFDFMCLIILVLLFILAIVFSICAGLDNGPLLCVFGLLAAIFFLATMIGGFLGL
jgi:hypothetical protein